MATRFYLRKAAADADLTASTDQALALTPGTTLSTDDRATVAGPTGMIVINDASSVQINWFSKPLNAVTISGTVTINFWMAESNMSANVTAAVQIIRASNTGTFISDIVAPTGNGPELPVTTRAAQNFTRTPTSTTLSAGDRIWVSCGGDDATAVNMGSGFSFNVGYDDDVGGADGDSWVEFTETITEQAAGPTPPPSTVKLQAVNRSRTY